MPDRSCPSCHEPVAAHQTLCPSCRTPVPAEAGPVATDTSAFTFTAPPPRRPAAPTASPPVEPPAPTAPPAPAAPVAPTWEPAPVVEPTAPRWEPAPAEDPTTIAPDGERGGDRAPLGAGSPPGSSWSPGADPGTAGPFAVAGEPTVAAGEATTSYGGGGVWQPAPQPDATWAAAPTAVPAAAAPHAVAPTSAGTLGTPGAAVLDERGNLPGGVAGLVAAALVTIGVFLPWIGVEGQDVSGWAASGDAKVLLGIAALATVIAALLIGGARSIVLRLGLVGLGVVSLALGAYEVASANGIDEFDVSLGTGLFLVLAGGLVLAGAGLLTRHKRYL